MEVLILVTEPKEFHYNNICIYSLIPRDNEWRLYVLVSDKFKFSIRKRLTKNLILKCAWFLGSGNKERLIETAIEDKKILRKIRWTY